MSNCHSRHGIFLDFVKKYDNISRKWELGWGARGAQTESMAGADGTYGGVQPMCIGLAPNEAYTQCR